MFPVAIVLIAMGYTVLYYAGSMSKTYNAVHDLDLSPNNKGGVPFGVLLGVNRNPRVGGGPDVVGQNESFPPFITGTAHHRPRGES